MEGYGLITCAHCVGPKLYVYNPSDHTKKYPVTVIAQEVHIDLAILTIPPVLSGVHSNSTQQRTGPYQRRYNSAFGISGASCRAPNSRRVRNNYSDFSEERRYFLEITPKIIGGNSGGPVVNDKFEVVGIAVLGLNGKIDLKSTEFLAVSVNELKNLPKVKAKK